MFVPMITRRLKLFKLLLSLLQVKKLKLSMNGKFIQNLCNDFFIFIGYNNQSQDQIVGKHCSITHFFLLMTEPVLSSVVPTKGNMAVYFVNPEITVVCGLLVCVMHNRIVFSKLLLCTQVGMSHFRQRLGSWPGKA